MGLFTMNKEKLMLDLLDLIDYSERVLQRRSVTISEELQEDAKIEVIKEIISNIESGNYD